MENVVANDTNIVSEAVMQLAQQLVAQENVQPVVEEIPATKKNELSYEKVTEELLGQLVSLKKTADEIEQKEALIKTELEKIMLEHKVESMESDKFEDLVSVSLVKGSESESFDLKKFQKDNPVEYAQLFVKYKKVTVKKPYLRITVKPKK